MSIFSDNITTTVKVLDVYNFGAIGTHNSWETMDSVESFNFIIRNTFSINKISNYINEHNTRGDGSKILDRPWIDHFTQCFTDRYLIFDKIFIGLILVLILSDGFGKEYLENIYNSLIHDLRYKNGSRVGIKTVTEGDNMKIWFWVGSMQTKNRFYILLAPKDKSF